MNKENSNKFQKEKFVDQRVTIIVKGNVHKVGYRDFVYKLAESLEIKGTIENLTDGNVKIIAEEKKKNLEEFIDRIGNFPFINEIIVEFGEPKNEFGHFNIKLDGMTSGLSDNLLSILDSGVIAINNIFQQLSEMNKRIEEIESILTIKETEKKGSQNYSESKIGRVLIFGPGQGSEDYRYRENVREILEEHFETIFPEDFDDITELMDWYKEHGISLTENQAELSNRSSATKELILADHCSYVYIILISPGAISEFSQFYIDIIAYKIRIFIPLEYYKSDSYISSGPLKVFGEKYNQVYPFKNESELRGLVREKAIADFEHEYLIKRRTMPPFII